MIQTFIEKNRSLLMFYYRAARIGGWLCISLSALAFVLNTIALASRLGDRAEFNRYWNHDLPWFWFSDILPTGLLILGIAQLIWYLLETDSKPGWILKYAYKLLYIYTAFFAAYYCWAGLHDVIVHFNEPHDFPLRLIFIVVFILIKLLALIGIAELLRRSLPMIEESRTLV